MGSLNRQFRKLLVGKYSPKNKCAVEDGEVLSVTPRRDVPMKEHVAHCFRGTRNRGSRCQYGWVKEVEPFAYEDFVRVHLLGDQPDALTRQHLEVMFNSIQELPGGTPVAATYSCRGVEHRTMEFTVHKVFFYRGN
jgi:hypothetical protein